MPVCAELVTAAHIFTRNEAMLAKATNGLTGEQWLSRPADASNSALWIVGHITWARSRALKLLGVEWTAPWLPLFERGSKPVEDSQYPSYEDVLAAWKELATSLPQALEAAPAATFSAAAPQPSPSFDGTVGGMVGFLAMHETYHVGQAVYLRRLLGHERIVG